MTGIGDLQEQLSGALKAVAEVGESATVAWLAVDELKHKLRKTQGAYAMAAVDELKRKLRKAQGAYAMAAESRELWKRRAITAGWAPTVPVPVMLMEQPDRPDELWNPSAAPGEQVTLSGAVGQALGTASMSWTDVRSAGTFKDGHAAWVLEGIMAWLSDWADEMRREANEATAAKIRADLGYYDDQTLEKVRAGLLCSSGLVVNSETVNDIITQMQNEGILFREREPQSCPAGWLGRIDHDHDGVFRHDGGSFCNHTSAGIKLSAV